MWIQRSRKGRSKQRQVAVALEFAAEPVVDGTREVSQAVRTPAHHVLAPAIARLAGKSLEVSLGRTQNYEDLGWSQKVLGNDDITATRSPICSTDPPWRACPGLS